jgi:hypothetical protein
MPKRQALKLTDEQQSGCSFPHMGQLVSIPTAEQSPPLFIAAGLAPAAGAREKPWHSPDPDTQPSLHGDPIYHTASSFPLTSTRRSQTHNQWRTKTTILVRSLFP